MDLLETMESHCLLEKITVDSWTNGLWREILEGSNEDYGGKTKISS